MDEVLVEETNCGRGLQCGNCWKIWFLDQGRVQEGDKLERALVVVVGVNVGGGGTCGDAN